MTTFALIINLVQEISMSSSNVTPSPERQLDMFVLDVLRHDVVEQLSSVVRLLNDTTCIGWRQFWPHDFSSSEVVPALLDLERSGLVRALRETEGENQLAPIPSGQLDSSEAEEVWFGLTEKGRRLWEEWEPPS
jgi:hypothetical protein